MERGRGRGKYAKRAVVDKLSTHKDDVQDVKTNELVLAVA
jgi:hypothetical protein